MPFRIFIFALIVFTLAGCAPLAPSSAPGSQPGTDTGASPHPTSAPKGSNNRTAGDPSKSPVGEPTPGGNPSPTKGALPMRTSISSDCGRRGDRMVVEITTRKMAQIAIGVSYSDQNPHGNYTVGNADDVGRFTYRWVIPATAPLGNAQVLIAAGDYTPGPEPYSGSSTGESNSARLPFRVAVSC